MPKRRATASPPATRRWPRVTDEIVLELVACPACHGRLSRSDGGLACEACRHTYPIVDSIPVLLADVGEGPEAGRSQAQAAFFDEAVNAEFEIERPKGTPRLYRWHLE